MLALQSTEGSLRKGQMGEAVLFTGSMNELESQMACSLVRIQGP